ncbi:MAG: ImmA/IrrE family metallo-endopeptidase [Halobacteriovoraceae bacterium]|nr:ImmA/IrrE family metallo-endopeptidase [Halobacteriovoraceae bacterium]
MGLLFSVPWFCDSEYRVKPLLEAPLRATFSPQALNSCLINSARKYIMREANMGGYKTEDIERIVNEQLGENPVFPVEVVKIANKLGYRIFYLEKDVGKRSIAGKVDHKGQSIFVRPSDPVQRQRFTIAHETGHILLHGNKGKNTHFRDDKDIKVAVYSDNIEEIEANKFAAMLLMPDFEFKRMWGHCNGAIEDIADYFNVSRLATAIRANTLGFIQL